MDSILVVAAHPDDEILGCGGAIARHSEIGDLVRVLIVSTGITSRGDNIAGEIHGKDLEALKYSAKKANQVIGVESLDFLNYPDNRLDSIQRLDLIKDLEKKITEFQPNIIYTHHSGDLNIDHRIVCDAVITACRPYPNQIVKTILSFEVASSTEWQPIGKSDAFEPNWFVDISKQLSKKLEALKEYDSEMRDWPHARSIQAVDYQAKLRGSQLGVNAAEAFKLLRKLI